MQSKRLSCKRFADLIGFVGIRITITIGGRICDFSEKS